MQKNPWKTVVWIVESVFLFLALTAPFNPFINTKFGVAAWCYFMIGLGCVGVVIACLLAYPPEDFSIKD